MSEQTLLAHWEGPAAGTVIAATYRVVRPLGQGGMGAVVLARDERLERDVAIKFVRPSFAAHAKVRDRFAAEARAMARVEHVNVLRVFASGEVDGAPYFVMEYVPGTTLARWMREHLQADALPSRDEALGLIDQVCQGSAAIHAAGLVHGDLKPSNVLVGPASRVAVADLGLTRALGETLSGVPMGTPAYMAPELAREHVPHELVARADVFSLGVMAYEALVGVAPYAVETFVDLLHIERVPPLRPTEARPELSAAFDDVLLEAVAADPLERTPSVDALREGLLAAREAAARSYGGLRIVVADDDENFLALAREVLAFALPGAEIECATDGEQALAALDRCPASLALVDLDMPRMNGVELTAALRAGQQRPAVIVVTAAGGAPDWRLLQSLGADGFLVKPLDPDALVSKARQVVDTRARRP